MTELRQILVRRAELVLTAILTTILVTMAVSLQSFERSQQESLGDDLERLQRMQSIVAYEPKLAAVVSNQGSGLDESLLLGEGTPAELAAALQSRINALALRRGVQVLRSGDAQPGSYEALRLIGADLEMSGSADAVYGLLGDIEAERPPLAVDRLVLRSSGSSPAEDRGDLPLSVSLRVYGATRAALPAGSPQ